MNPESNKTFLKREQALGKIATIAKKAAKIVLPLPAIGVFATKAQAQFQNLEIVRALNNILQIEFMEELFYVRAIISEGFLTGQNSTIFREITKNQQAHVVFTKNVIVQQLKQESAPQLDFDFSADGRFNPFNDFDEFLMLAQIIEDTAVGIYKRQIEILHENNAGDIILRSIMRAYSVEARHAYYIRFLRSQRRLNNLKGWISDRENNFVVEEAQDIYANEDTLTQDGVNIPSISDVSREAIREAWDEPVGRGPANNIFQLFNATPNFR